MTRGLVRITDEETPILQGLAADVPENGIIIEIGSAWGYSISKMAEVSKRSVTLFAIDPWTLGGQKQQPARERQFREITAPYKNIRKIKAFSQDVDWKVEIDLLFIDGNHQYNFVSGDYLKFSPFVKKDGILVFHDYLEERAPGVTRAVAEFVIPSGLWDWHTQERFWIGRRRENV